MADFIDISAWNPQPFVNTGGTRDKLLVQGPDQKFYFFKNSYRSKEGTYYRYEFWSEIIAYELGTMFDLNILRYDIAINDKKIGCLSRSMIELDKEQLLEGGKYLTAMSNTFRPEQRGNQKLYTMQLINTAFAFYKFQSFIPDFLRMLVFDAIIGNGDRHQDNWAFITEIDQLTEEMIQTNEAFKKNKSGKYMSKVTRSLYEKVKRIFEVGSPQEFDQVVNKLSVFGKPENIRFSPIYDSGSSLGRELEEARIEQMLQQKIELEAFAFRGKSEVHWDGKKLRHFDLLAKILQEPDLRETLKKVGREMCSKFNTNAFQIALSGIDSMLPDEFLGYCIPASRKEFIFKVVTLRIEKLKELVSRG